MNIDFDSYKANAFITNLEENVVRKTTQVIKKWNMRILNDAIENVNVDRGMLQDSINETILYLAGRIIGKIGTNLFYAPYVHGVWVNGKWIGPKPHFVPFAVAPDLLIWARRKGVIEIIDGKIYKKNQDGTLTGPIKGLFIKGNVNPFLGDAFDKYKDRIVQELSSINVNEGESK